MNRFPNIISSFYIKFIKLIRKRNIKNTLVPLSKFSSNLDIYFQRCVIESVQQVIIIGISYPNEKMVVKNPGIVSNVVKYNKIFFEFAEKYDFITFITPLDSRDHKEEIFEDGYHPNIYGNDLVFNSISKVIA